MRVSRSTDTIQPYSTPETHRKLVEIHRTAADDDDRAVSPGTHVREERVRHLDHAEKVDLKRVRHPLNPSISKNKKK